MNELGTGFYDCKPVPIFVISNLSYRREKTEP